MVEGMSVVVTVVSNECYEPSPCPVQPIGALGGEIITVGVLALA